MTNIQDCIARYKPSSATRKLIAQTKIVLLVGISGAGKDTTKRQLLRQPEFADIVSYTTRAPRQNLGVWEQEGVDYNFIDESTVKAMLDRHEFVEAKFVHGTVYGTGVAQIQAIHDVGKIAITDIDVQGVDEYKALSKGVVAIFLLPPNYTEWRSRLSARYATNEEFEREWPKRCRSAVQELTHALEVPYYHFVINGQLEGTVRTVREIAIHPDLYDDRRKDDEARLVAQELLDELLTNASKYVQ